MLGVQRSALLGRLDGMTKYGLPEPLPSPELPPPSELLSVGMMGLGMAVKLPLLDPPLLPPELPPELLALLQNNQALTHAKHFLSCGIQRPR